MPTSSISSETLPTVIAPKPLASPQAPAKATEAKQPEVFYDAKESLQPPGEAGPLDAMSKPAPAQLQQGPSKATPAPTRPPSVQSVKAAIQDADAVSLASKKSKASAHSSATPAYEKLNSDAASDVSSVRSSLSARPVPGVPSDAAAEFSVKVAALGKQTKIARNFMPMILRGGVIASLGMLLFGHLAPLAIFGVLVGALVGGYVVAKALQLYQARKFAALGDASPIEQLKRNIPNDASQADLDKFYKIVDFIEKGDVFDAGFVKAFREPYRAVKQRVGKALDAYQAAKTQKAAVTATPSVAPQDKQEQLRDDAASDSSGLSEAQKYKKSVLEAEAFAKADPQAESEPLLKKPAVEV